MIYCYISPSLCLQDFVKEYLLVHFVFGKNQPIPHKSYSPKTGNKLLH